MVVARYLVGKWTGYKLLKEVAYIVLGICVE
jgi:uncharacterized membrane protein SirB2